MEFKKTCLTIFAELFATLLFVFIGCGSVMSVVGLAQDTSYVLPIALTFGLAIAVLVYSIGDISGGHINPAVTFSLMMTRDVDLLLGVGYITAQLIGGILGAGLLLALFGEDNFIAANTLNPSISPWRGFLGEGMFTMLLVFVVHMTAVGKNDANTPLAPLAIGLAIFLAHIVLIPVTGCGINPARTLGPAIMQNEFSNQWIYWLGPLLGSGLGCGFATATKIKLQG